MTIKVDPELNESTHDILLTDGQRSIGLIICNKDGARDPAAINRVPIESNAFKTSSGNTSYSDMDYPWTPTAQQSWAGGRAYKEFDSEVTRYFDGKRANTLYTKIIHGPQEQIVPGNRNMEVNLPGNVRWSILTGSRLNLAIKFTASADYDAVNIYLHLKKYGNPGALTISLCEDDIGDPGAELQTDTVSTAEITDILAEFYKFTITAETLAIGSDYWIKVEAASTDGADNHWKVGVKNSTGTTEASSDGITWEGVSVDIYYLLTDADVAYRPLFFQYKRALYLLENAESGAPKLWIIGDRGVADANAGDLTKLNDGTKSWVTDSLIGGVVLVIGGAGSTETRPYRNITSNTGQAITLDSAWLIAHDTTTEYVILGSPVMFEIASATHGLTGPVTDVLVINDIVYFCQGDSILIRRYIWDQNAGAERHRWDDDNVYATYLKPLVDQTSGLIIMAAQNSPAKKIYSSPVKDWGTDLVFTEKYHFKDDFGKITYIWAYGSPQYLWIFREGTVYQYVNTYVEEIPLTEIRAFMSDKNGYGALPHNVYLYFPLRYGLERYYNANLDDLGPDREEGLPIDRQGFITKLIGYPGIVYAFIDGEDSNYSSILGYNQEGWMELYRAPMPGMRIQDGIFQVIPGENLDRMYIYTGGLVMWLPFPKKSKKPTSDPNYLYTHEAMVESGWIYTEMKDLHKFYNSVKMWAENLSDENQYVEVDYKVDKEETWTTINGQLSEVPVDELFIGNDLLAVGGRRIKLRIRSQTNDALITPEIGTVIVDTVSRITIRYAYAFRYRAMDMDINIHGEMNDEQKAYYIQDLIDHWAETLKPLRMRSRYELFDDKRVFIDGVPIHPFKEKKEGYIGELIINQVKQNIRQESISA